MKILQTLVLILSLVFVAFAQNEGKTTQLSGNISDQTGGAIADVKVSLKNVKGLKFETFSNENGIYVLSVPGGTYTVEAEYMGHKGWEKFKVENFEIASAGKFSLDITLRVNTAFVEKISEPLIGKLSENDNKTSRVTSTLSGTVYDANGARIFKAKVTAVNQKGEKFETLTNDEGAYTLNLTYIPIVPGFSYKMAKYDITVEAAGFETFTLKDFKVTGKYTAKMQLDLALDVLVIFDPITVVPTENKKPK